MGGGRAVRVLVVAQTQLHSQALAHVLDRRRALAVVGTANDAEEAVARVAAGQPDVVLLDLGLVDSDVVLRALSDDGTPRVVALSDGCDDRGLAACVRARVGGYVTVHEGPEQLGTTIESVARGELRCSSSTAGALLDRLAAIDGRAAGAGDAALTTREREVLRLVELGLANKEIARRLAIELPTVKHHVRAILRKLGVSRRTEAVARCRGLVEGWD